MADRFVPGSDKLFSFAKLGLVGMKAGMEEAVVEP
jgi:hypothetical protein